ncbi:helix-turn-helix domain-containing protein [Streptomyces sp. 4N509B]|uniref:helix-turn-helix domain-containing protein n=1 Tax=Streptomyces sp. 4N509B TaxID=3457413 RepID=UPI003FD27642
MAEGPITRRRQLGLRLRALREGTGLSAREAGERAGVSKATVSRYEGGKGTVRWNQVDQLCRVYGVLDDVREELVGLAKNSAPTEGWWVPALGELSGELGDLILLENEARRIEQLAITVVPGLLQTRDYAAALPSAPQQALSEEALDRLLDTRMQRQSVVRGPEAPEYRVILDESVLRRAVGSPDTMAGQLDSLLERGREPHVTIQVLPFAAGAYAVTANNFIYLSGHEPALDVVYVETTTGALFHEKPEERAPYSSAFAYLSEQALDPDSSARLIAEVRRTHQKT